MANYLTIDIGNSSAKAALWTEGKLAAPPIWGDLGPVDIEHLCAQAGLRPAAAAVCSVASDEQGLAQAAARLAGKMIELGPSTPVPVDFGAYQTGATLGADRVAAMCGARALMPVCERLLVVDCGSAVTYDLLEGNAFAGGNIAPGIGMRLRALHAFTARLPEVGSEQPSELFGTSTASAMQAGAWHGVAAETTYYYHRAGHDCRVVLTGGRAAELGAMLGMPILIDTNLVLRGLKNIIEYNESL